MIKIFLKDFIKTGKLGPIEIGASKEDVIDFLGDDYDFGDFGETQIIKYGWWEFFYWTESKKIFAFQNDHLSYCDSHHIQMISLKTDKVEMDTWFLKPDKHITFDNITKILSDEKIDFKLDKFSKNDELDILRLKNDITFDFDNELTTWTFDEKNEEYDRIDISIDTPSDYILNGIRLFKY